MINTRTKIIGLGVCLITMGIYNALYFNKSLPFNYGWFSVFADNILKGQMPYRDFYFFLPPVYPYIIAGFSHIFGASLFLLSILGIAVVLSLTGLLFILLLRIFPVHIACVATIVSMFFYQSDVGFTAYNFICFVDIFAILGVLLICKYFDTRGWLYLCLAGVLGALAFLTKQSDGLYILGFSFLAVLIAAYVKDGFRKGFRRVAVYSAGVLIPLAYVFVWLSANGALKLFWNQVFVGASASKGGLIAILFAWIPRLLTVWSVVGLFLVGLLLLTIRMVFFPQGFKMEQFWDGTKGISSNVTLLIIAALFVLCILIPFWGVGFSNSLNNNDVFRFIRYNAMAITFVASLIICGVYFVKLKERKCFNIFIIATISLGILWGTSTSAGIGVAGMVIAFGLAIGWVASILSYRRIGEAVFIIVSVVVSMYFVSTKYVQPYDWWGQEQPDIRTSSVPVNVKYLKGFILSEQNAQIYEQVTAIIARDTKPDDRIYTFPDIPVFYLLTDRVSTTPDVVSWFDVLPDRPAREDAVLLMKSPPAAIVYLDVPEWVWKAHESAFRGGEPSGQRQIVAAINTLTSSGGYKLEAKYNLPNEYILSLWVKNDK